MPRTILTEVGGWPVRSMRVEVVAGPNKGKVHLTKDERLTVGSDPTNGLVLSDPTVSGFHFDLQREKQGILIVDHGSTNGTMLAGARLERALLRPGSTIKAGNSSLTIDDGETVTVETFEGDAFHGLVGRAPSMRRLMAELMRAAPSDAPVLLLGETGVGKEVAARAIHDGSSRAGGPFEVVDCGAILPTLLTSELFGHERGSFTGAHDQHVGAFERANGGTLFLDEIGELPSDTQSALLGALERKSFRRVGGKKTISVDVRPIFATHRDLRREVNAGTFRRDLFYRIAVVTVLIPALRERSEDVPVLIERFLRQRGFNGHLEDLFSPDSLAKLMLHRWPGNVRELRNIVDSTLVMGGPPRLEEEADDGAPQGSGELSFDRFFGRPYADARSALLDAFEQSYFVDLLERAGGSVTEAAKLGQMNRSYLSQLLRKKGIRGRDDV
ncbi:MAG: sigma 54-dependent Fis family transcriptional regulator [Deltaproteobacteria bacterium]|nr:sigma 54-dependent Fis family transcriptional regulator [Deltaproteobacteria bacterium]